MRAPSRLANLWRLTQLYESELRLLPGVSAARGSAVLVTAAAGSLMAGQRLLDGHGQAGVAVGALVWLSWMVGGLIALSAVRNWTAFQGPLRQLAAERGVSESSQDRAAPLALLTRITLAVGIPALLLAAFAVALSSNSAQALERLSLLLSMPLYALLLAGGLSLLAYLSASMSGRSSGSWLAALVIGPHLLRELWPYTPSVIAVYGSLLDQILRLGGGA